LKDFLFFLERKNQRTFDRLPGGVGRRAIATTRLYGRNCSPADAPGQTIKSLFASFSSEKEEFFL
jgi:hypothetical protein